MDNFKPAELQLAIDIGITQGNSSSESGFGGSLLRRAAGKGKAKAGVVITAMCVHEQTVYCGMADGRVLVHDASGANETLLAARKLGRKPVQQITVVPLPVNCLLALCGGKLTVHLLQTADLSPHSASTQEIGRQCKLVQRFCFDQLGAPYFRLCVATKRKLHLFQYDDSAGSFVFAKDFPLPNGEASALAWCDRAICIGNATRGYVMLDVVSGNVQDIPVPMEVDTTPCIGGFRRSSSCWRAHRELGCW